MTPTARRTRLLLAAAGVTGAVVAAASTAGSQGLPPPVLGTYEAVAVADGLHGTYTIPDFAAVEEVFDGSTITASALISSFGVATGLASAPYPGETAVSLGGTLAGLTGVPAPPEYPLVARSDPFSPDASVENQGYRLEAHSKDRSVRASAELGQRGDARSGSSTLAEVLVEPDRARVVAAARSTTDGATYSGVLSIGRVRAEASVIRTAGGEPVRHHDLTIDSISAGGIGLVVGPDGLDLAGQATLPVNLDAVLANLEASGVTITYLAPTETADGIVSGGLAVSGPTDFSALPGGPTGRYTVTYGRASAEARAGEATPTIAPTDLQQLPAPAPGADGAPAAAPPPVGSPFELDASSPAFRSEPASANAAIAPSAEPAGSTRLLATVPFSVWSLYLFVVIAAASTVAAIHLARTFGEGAP
ncbi:MAG TPA: hypothetical protein VGA13_13365 [Acidimicrobiales bacterium]